MRPRSTPLVAALVVALAACAAPEAAQPPEAPLASSPLPTLASLEGRQVFEPQLVVEDDGTIVAVWRERVGERFDLFAAHVIDDGALSDPSRVNDEPGTLYSYPHDEMRPAVATGSGGLLGVVWTDSRAQIRGAVSRDHGATWEPSVRLDQADAPAYRSFTAADFDDSGGLHAIWIDSRFAPQAGAEEPADLFYARLANGSVEEVNLTESQEPSICGCCRPHLRADSPDGIEATFRNTTADGYRDIHTISGSVDGGFSEAIRVGAPLWELQGCPMSGPVSIGGEVLWSDGSTGKKVLMIGRPSDEVAAALFEAGPEDEWMPRLAPRAVAGTEALLLLPGRPASRLVRRTDTGWRTVAEDVPPWATTAVTSGGAVLLVGAVDGELREETRKESW